MGCKQQKWGASRRQIEFCDQEIRERSTEQQTV